MIKIGVVHGRFQPFHNDHLKYFFGALDHIDFLIIGITNPDCQNFSKHTSDSNRLTLINNPLSYWERILIIKKSLEDHGIPSNKFTFSPFHFQDPDLFYNYVPINAEFYITIYDDWGKYKFNTLKSYGLNVQVLWEKNIDQKEISGSQIRQKILDGGKWEHLVPEPCSSFLKNINFKERLKLLAENQSKS